MMLFTSSFRACCNKRLRSKVIIVGLACRNAHNQLTELYIGCGATVYLKLVDTSANVWANRNTDASTNGIESSSMHLSHSTMRYFGNALAMNIGFSVFLRAINYEPGKRAFKTYFYGFCLCEKTKPYIIFLKCFIFNELNELYLFRDESHVSSGTKESCDAADSLHEH